MKIRLLAITIVGISILAAFVIVRVSNPPLAKLSPLPTEKNRKQY